MRERWKVTFCKPSPMFQWLVHMEEHNFYFFLIKSIATTAIRSRSSLLIQDREKTLAMAPVCTDEMRDECQYFKSFRYGDELLPYVSSVLEHVKAVINLRIPLDKEFTFPLALS